MRPPHAATAALNAGLYAGSHWAVNAGAAVFMALLAVMPERKSC